MNLDLIKKKLQEINEQSSERQDNSALKWTCPNGKSQIRIVPSKNNKDNPFTELMFYNKLSKFPILALTNFNEQDPVQEFIETLRATDDKDNWSLSGKISARPRYFVPVIVRGEEDKGVRIWSISATIYKALLNLAADEEIGDFTDIENGTDMVVEKTPPATPGAFADITIRARRNSTPLSENKDEIKTWLKEQPDPLDLFRKPSYDWLKKQLKAFVEGKPVESEAPKEETKEEAAPAAPKEEVKEEAPKTEFKVAKPKATKKSATTKFDDLFKDDEKEGEEAAEDDDKLPWENKGKK